MIEQSQLIVVAGKDREENAIIHKKIYENYLDNIMVFIIDAETKLDKAFKFYKNINVTEITSIYICKNNTCSLPFTDINLLKEYL